MEQPEAEGDEPGLCAASPSRPRAWATISLATKTIDRAMIASTGGPGTLMTPSVASASVIEWAMVKAVTVHNSRRLPFTSMTSASTNSR
jgi:hypothetical protein